MGLRFMWMQRAHIHVYVWSASATSIFVDNLCILSILFLIQMALTNSFFLFRTLGVALFVTPNLLICFNHTKSGNQNISRIDFFFSQRSHWIWLIYDVHIFFIFTVVVSFDVNFNWFQSDIGYFNKCNIHKIML